MRILILGAGGYVGSRLLEALRNSEWAVPVAAVRPRAIGRVSLMGAEERSYEANDLGSLRAALRNIDCVVNCVAGDTKTMVAGSKHVFDCSLEMKIQRVIHLSSMAVYGDATGTVDEQWPLASDGDAYAKAKIAVEHAAEDCARRGGRVVVLRPSCIYGPGSMQWTGRIGRLLRTGRIGDLGPDGDGYCNLIYIDDMIDAIIQAIRRPQLDGEAFNVSNPDADTWNNYFIKLGRALGATPIRRISSGRLKLESTFAAPVLKGGAELCRRLGIGADSLPPPISPSLARLWRQEIRLDHRKSRELLDFSLTPVAEGIARSARWLKS